MARKNAYIYEVSKHLGSKIQMLRMSQGYTGQQLAKMIDVSYQQLRKYELGINILSVGRLILIANALGKDLTYFFENMDTNKKPLTTEHQHMCVNLARNFMKIENPEHQKAVNNLVKMLAKVA